MADVDLRVLERQLRLNPDDVLLYNQLVRAYARAGLFAIEETPVSFVFWNVEHVRIVNNVPVRDVKVSVELTKEFLDNGRPHTQQEWVKIAKKQGYELPDTLTIYSILRALYINFQNKHFQQTKIIQARNLFTSHFDKYPTTGTRIIYRQKGPDYIIHRWATKKDTTIKTEMRLEPTTSNPNLVGAELTIIPLQTQAILGTTDINEANKVIKWTTNTKNNLLFVILTQPKQNDERAVVLGRGVGNGRFVFFCSDFIIVGRQTCGVAVR